MVFVRLNRFYFCFFIYFTCNIDLIDIYLCQQGGEQHMPVEQMMTLRALRVRMGWTQTDVAMKLDLNKETISKWEKNSDDMPLKYIDVFADLYKYPKNGIFFGNSIDLTDILLKDK